MYELPEGYNIRWEPEYWEDAPCTEDGVQSETGVLWQAAVYDHAYEVAERIKPERVLDIGCGCGHKLKRFAERWPVVGIDTGANIERCRRQHTWGTWLEMDITRHILQKYLLSGSLIICADIIEHLIEPEMLLYQIRRALDYGARHCVLSTPDRVALYGIAHMGPPPHKAHTMEWSCVEMTKMLRLKSLRSEGSFVPPHDHTDERTTMMIDITGADV